MIQLNFPARSSRVFFGAILGSEVSYFPVHQRQRELDIVPLSKQEIKDT